MGPRVFNMTRRDVDGVRKERKAGEARSRTADAKCVTVKGRERSRMCISSIRGKLNVEERR